MTSFRESLSDRGIRLRTPGSRIPRFAQNDVKGVIAIAGMCSLWPAAAAPVDDEPNPIVRVGLVRLAHGVRTATITAPEGARLSDPLDSNLLKGPAVWALSAEDDGVTVTDGDGKVLITGPKLRILPSPEGNAEPITVEAGGAKRRYRGVLEVAEDTPRGGLRFTDSKPSLVIVDELPLETYLRGVIAAEMPSTAPAEALRAQAVAARTYALKSRGKYRGMPYDLNDTTDSQMYDGAGAEKLSTDAAVRDTAGVVLRKDGALLLADYYDDCGGITSPGDRDGDYPPSVVDAPGDGGGDYCAAGTYHAWTLSLTPDELSKALGAGKGGVGKVTSVHVVSTDSSGRARTVEVTGEHGKRTLTGPAFRAALGYSRLKSTLFTVAQDEEGPFVFTGRGYGHGHGLCQWGAMGMAAPPYNRTYQEILTHYFPGAQVVDISRLPGDH